MIKEIENIKEEIKQLRIKNEELNNRLIELIENDKKIRRDDGCHLPEPENEQKYYSFITGEDSSLKTYKYNSRYDTNNHKRFNCFLNEEKAKRRSKQIENYFKILHYLEAVNGDWKPDWGNFGETKYCIQYRDDIKGCLNDTYAWYEVLSFKSGEARDNFRKYVSDEEIRTFLNPLGVI